MTIESTTELLDVMGAWDGDGDFRYGDTPADISHDNHRRAGFAATALNAFVNRVRSDDELETAIVDLVADIHHLCDAAGISFTTVLDMADMHYEPETRGEV